MPGSAGPPPSNAVPASDLEFQWQQLDARNDNTLPALDSDRFPLKAAGRLHEWQWHHNYRAIKLYDLPALEPHEFLAIEHQDRHAIGHQEPLTLDAHDYTLPLEVNKHPTLDCRDLFLALESQDVFEIEAQDHHAIDQRPLALEPQEHLATELQDLIALTSSGSSTTRSQYYLASECSPARGGLAPVFLAPGGSCSKCGSVSQPPGAVARPSIALDHVPSGSSNTAQYLCFEHGCNGKRFKSKDNYRRHVRERQRSISGGFICFFCHRSFARNSNLETHIALIRCKALKQISMFATDAQLGLNAGCMLPSD